MPEKTVNTVDHGALRANQGTIIALNLLAFVLNAWPLAAAVALAMAAGTALGKPGFLPLYRYVLLPLSLAKPKPLEDDPAPHRFAQGFGAAVMLAGSAILAAGSAAGWILVGLVAALALLNVAVGFCAGCFLYYQLGRLGIPPFSKGA